MSDVDAIARRLSRALGGAPISSRWLGPHVVVEATSWSAAHGRIVVSGEGRTLLEALLKAEASIRAPRIAVPAVTP